MSTYAASVRTAEKRPRPQALAHFVRHPRLPLLTFSAASMVMLAGTFLPWLRSGTTTRSSYDLLGLLGRLDIAADGIVASLVRWWPIVPLLVTMAVVAAWWGRVRLAVVVAAFAVIYGGGVAADLILRARRAGVDVAFGPWVCGAGAVAMLCSAVWMLRADSHDQTGQ